MKGELHPQDLACFDNVAAVVGQANAMEALQDAIDRNAIVVPEWDRVGSAILWGDTSGGIKYWDKINLKIKENKRLASRQRMGNNTQNSNDGEHYCTLTREHD